MARRKSVPSGKTLQIGLTAGSSILSAIAGLVAFGASIITFLADTTGRASRITVPTFDFDAFVRALNGVDLLAFVATNKFEVTAACGLVCVVLFIVRYGSDTLTPSGLSGLIFAFLAGASLPAGVLFGLVAFFPDRVEMLLDFREFVLMAGIALTAASAIGIRNALWGEDEEA